MTVFDAYVMVDWSAESRPKRGPDSIWWHCLERGAGAREGNPATREQAAGELADLFSDLVARNRVTLAGFDFAFGYPHGFAARLGCGEPPWRGVWKAFGRHVRDDGKNVNNRFAVAAEFNNRLTGRAAPFWGCPESAAEVTLTTRKPESCGVPERRLAEKRATHAKSVWQTFGNGSVGSQTLLGIPRLLALRHHPWLEDAARVWPFETGLVPLTRPGEGGWRLMLAEIYPSLVPTMLRPGEVKDQAQVRALAAHFARLDEAGALAPLFAGDPALSPEERALAEREEGWILGVGAGPPPAGAYLRDPAAIYRESAAAIRREIDLDALPADLADLVLRIVHACGMPDIVADLAFSPGAGAAGRAALAKGAPVIADCEMVAHGVIRRLLPQANPVICTLNAPEVAGLAATQGTTRSAAAVELWRQHLAGAVVAIGNAPTALFRLLELVAEGAPRPALVLGFPVGFVGAAESKAALAASGLPFVTLQGRRGGSAMAAAAVNALAGGMP